MRRRQVTREWNRSTVKQTSRLRGVRHGRRWFRWVGVAGLLLFAFLMGRGFNQSGEDSVAVEVISTDLDIGGASRAGETVAEVLSGQVLSIPVGDAIVLEQEADQEADIAQDIRDVSVASDAQVVQLAPIKDFRGVASASSQYSDEGFQHIIVATLPNPPVGYFYEGWLIRSKPFDFFSTGRFIQQADDLKWYLLWQGSEDKGDYRKVVITLEPEDGDAAPAEHVMEGVLD